MSLIVICEPKIQNAKMASELEIGTWFLNKEGHISAILIDDRTLERRVMTIDDTNYPFITKSRIQDFKVQKILPYGTTLQIIPAGIFGEQHND